MRQNENEKRAVKKIHAHLNEIEAANIGQETKRNEQEESKAVKATALLLQTRLIDTSQVRQNILTLADRQEQSSKKVGQAVPEPMDLQFSNRNKDLRLKLIYGDPNIMLPNHNKLNTFDLDVLDTLFSMYAEIQKLPEDMRGKQYITPAQVYRFLYPPKKESGGITFEKTEELIKSIDKLRACMVQIDISEALRKAKPRFKGKLTKEDNLAPLEKYELTSENNGKEAKEVFYKFKNDAPIVFTYFMTVEHYLAIDVDAWNTSKHFRNSKEGAALKSYLIQRIAQIRNKGIVSENGKFITGTIKYDALFEHLGNADSSREQKRKIRDKAKVILEHFKKNALINSFEDETETRQGGKTPTGVVVTCDNELSKKKKPPTQKARNKKQKEADKGNIEAEKK